MKREQLLREIKDKLEDILYYQNVRNPEKLLVTLPQSAAKHDITSAELFGVPVKYTHLDPKHIYRVHYKTRSGYVWRR